MCPQLFKQRLLAVVQRRLEQDLAAKLNMVPAAGEAHKPRALADLAQSAIKSKRWTPWARGCLKAWLMDGLWACSRAKQAGCVAPDMSPTLLCCP